MGNLWISHGLFPWLFLCLLEGISNCGIPHLEFRDLHFFSNLAMYLPIDISLKLATAIQQLPILATLLTNEHKT